MRSHAFRVSLQWRNNGLDCVTNHQSHDCLPNRLFGRRSKKTSKFRATGLCAGNSPVSSPHKWPVTKKMFQFHDVIMTVSHGIPIESSIKKMSPNIKSFRILSYWRCIKSLTKWSSFRLKHFRISLLWWKHTYFNQHFKLCYRGSNWQ